MSFGRRTLNAAGWLQRAVVAISWLTTANMVRVLFLAIRFVVLARLLEIDTFGSYAYALALVEITLIPTKFGMEAAFMHRHPEVEDEESAARTHFTIRVMLTAAWAALFLPVAISLTREDLRTALLVLIVTQGLGQLNQTPRLVLIRRIQHRRLAVLQVTAAGFTTLVAIGLAAAGAEIWALVATNIVTVVVTACSFYIWKPVWRPRFEWAPARIRYFLGFGGATMLARLIERGTQRLDTLWTAGFLGVESLGYYSRAGRMAGFPRQIAAQPVISVASGTFAELHLNRTSLTKAVDVSLNYLVFVGFIAAGALLVVAEPLVTWLLGARWMPMIPALQVMLVYAVLDPMRNVFAQLLLACGRPGLLVRVSILEGAVLCLALLVLAPAAGIVGVAAAVSLRAFVGLVAMWRISGRWVGLSVRGVWLAPLVSLCLAFGAESMVMWMLESPGPLWIRSVTSALCFFTVFMASYGILERQRVSDAIRYLRGQWKPSDA